jgi:hypothetical protein
MEGKMHKIKNVQNTIELQKFSVQQFMKRLGYTLYSTERGGLVFVSDSPFPTEFRVVGMNTAISLHNSGWDTLNGYCRANRKENFITDLYTLVQAVNAKVVDKVKIQYSGKKKQILASNQSDHIVTFVVAEYEQLFLEPEVE